MINKLLCPLCTAQFLSQDTEKYTLVECGKVNTADGNIKIYQCPRCGMCGDWNMWNVVYAYQTQINDFYDQLCELSHSLRDARGAYIMQQQAKKTKPCKTKQKGVKNG